MAIINVIDDKEEIVMDYAFEDEKRTKIIYANASDIVQYKGVRCYCKNPYCEARMFIYNPEHPSSAFFKASGKPSHNGSCGSIYNHFDNTEYDANLFNFPDVLIDLEKEPIKKKTCISGRTGSGEETFGKKGLKTIKEIYKMATNTPPNDEYNGIKLKDILADVRSYSEYEVGIMGYHLVECNFFRYENNEKAIIMNFPFLPNNRYYLRLVFENEELFRKERSRIYDTGHKGLIVISGLWQQIDEEYEKSTIKAECKIKSEKQIAIIK